MKSVGCEPLFRAILPQNIFPYPERKEESKKKMSVRTKQGKEGKKKREQTQPRRRSYTSSLFSTAVFPFFRAAGERKRNSVKRRRKNGRKEKKGGRSTASCHIILFSPEDQGLQKKKKG